VRRREFITVLGGTATVWPFAAQAQQNPKILEIGFLYTGNAAIPMARVTAFLNGLRSRGYVEGRDIRLVIRTAGANPEKHAPLADELIKRKVRVLFASGPATVRFAHASSRTIPIVAMDLESDPVKAGLVDSIARPGGNLTGLFFDFPEISAKWLQMLLEVKPGLARLGVLWDPTIGTFQLDAVTAEARSRGLSLHVFEVRSSDEIEPAIRSAQGEKVEGMIVLSAPPFGANPARLADLAARYRLPAITLFPEFAQAGGLMAYGTNLVDLFNQAGVLVGKVLDGAKPESLPVERPGKFQLVINLKTAKSLGLEVPSTLLARADEVIE
jgi:putative ABC transport system substrate-binding protein